MMQKDCTGRLLKRLMIKCKTLNCQACGSQVQHTINRRKKRIKGEKIKLFSYQEICPGKEVSFMGLFKAIGRVYDFIYKIVGLAFVVAFAIGLLMCVVGTVFILTARLLGY